MIWAFNEGLLIMECGDMGLVFGTLGRNSSLNCGGNAMVIER
jgi:hypothetical protein